MTEHRAMKPLQGLDRAITQSADVAALENGSFLAPSEGLFKS
jgi:hypothetical protein